MRLPKFINKKPKSSVAIAVILIIAGYWIILSAYETQREKSLFEKFKADPQWKQVTDMIETDKKDLAANPPKAKRIAATMDMGLQWFNLQQFDLAAKWWKKGLKIEPNNIIGWYNLGNARRELKYYWRAENAYGKSMEIARVGEIDACLALGEMYRYAYTAKRYSEGDVYLKCLKKHKDDRDLIARLALFYRDMGDRANAIIYFDKLFSIDPSAEVGEELRKLQAGAQ